MAYSCGLRVGELVALRLDQFDGRQPACIHVDGKGRRQRVLPLWKETTVAIPPAQLEQMTALVRETIGFNKDRGDSVNLVNAAFNVEKTTEATAPAWWQQADNQDFLRSLAWPIGMVGLGLLVLMGMVRPGLKLIKTPVRREQTELKPLSAMLNETPERPGLPMPGNEPTPESQRITDAKRLALENPMAVANIVKGWVNGESPA